MGMVRVRKPFLNYETPIVSLEWAKLGISDFVWQLILTTTSAYILDCTQECVQGHVASKFWKIIDNIS